MRHLKNTSRRRLKPLHEQTEAEFDFNQLQRLVGMITPPASTALTQAAAQKDKEAFLLALIDYLDDIPAILNKMGLRQSARNLLNVLKDLEKQT